jgi:hypothetical protein
VVGLRIRLVLVVAAALVLAAPAEAAYTSARLSVVNTRPQLGAGGPVTLSFAQSAADDSTARIVTYVPRGYAASLVPRQGDVLGTGRATLDRGDQRAIVTGELRAADPSRYRDEAQACADQPARLDAVYVLTVPDLQRTLELPVFVRPVPSGPEAAYASGALTVCFPRPGPPAQAGSAPRVLALSLTFRRLFANPSAAGAYRWRSLWTPYRDGARAGAATVEAQALDLLPLQLTLVTGRFDRRTRSFFVGGALLENRRPLPGGSIQLLAGLQGRRLERLGLTRTNANGNYGGRMRLTPGTWSLRARATVRARTRGGCAVRTVPGVRCLRTTTAGFTLSSRTVRVVVPRR